MKKIFLETVGVLFLISFAQAWEVREPVYLSPSFFDGKSEGQTLPAMPAHGSSQEKADFEELLNLQKTRTPQDCERAAYEVHISLENEYGPKYGPLTEKEVVAWSPFFEKLAYETDYFVAKEKKNFHRPRPYITEKKLHPCLKLESSDAYPSGHSTINRVFARVLAEIDPSRKKAFEDRGNQIAHDRVLGGVHHPSDIEAGKILGDEIFAALMKNEKFKKELNALKN
jgi:acid phosphatase (class A)